MANVIIGIHGLGNKPPEYLLKRWWKLAMIEGLKAHNFNTTLPEFFIAYWSDIIYDKYLDPSERNIISPYFIDEEYTSAPIDFPVDDYSTRRKVVDFLGRQMNRIFLNEDLTLNYSFISDAIIKRYFKDLEVYYTGRITKETDQISETGELIKERLKNKLQKHKDDNIMLIGHSMGSIIAFDVLTFLVPDIKINTFITMGSPLGLPVVISKIAAEQKSISTINNQVTTPPGIFKNWYNFSDILDKVAFNYKLSDYFSENLFGVKPVDFLVINNYKNNGTCNPHKSFGYLRASKFSEILNEFILTEKITIKQKINRKIVKLTDNLKSIVSIKKEN